jgi:fucose permease
MDLIFPLLYTLSMRKSSKLRHFITLLALLLALTGFAVSGNAVPPLMTTLSREMGTDISAFGYILSLQFFFFFLAALAGGWAGERFGIKPGILAAAGLLIMTVSLFIAPLLNKFYLFVLWSVPLGFAGGLTETFSTIMITRYDREGSGKILNLSQGFFTFGAVAAPWIISGILDRGISWRTAFFIFGGLLTVITFLFISGTKPFSKGTIDGMGEKPKPREPFRWSKHLILFSGALFFYVAVESAAVAWISAYFEESLGTSAGDAAWRLSIFWGGLLVSRLGMMVLPDRFTLWPAMIIGAAGMGVSFILFAPTSSPEFTTLLTGTAGFCAGPLWPSTVTAASQRFRSSRKTTIVIGAGALGVAAGPFTGSLIIKIAGLKSIFPIFGTAALFLLFLYLTLYLGRHR